MKLIYFFDLEGVIGLYTLEDEKKCLELSLQEINEVIEILSKYSEIELTFCDCHNNGKMNSVLKSNYSHISFLSNIWQITRKNQYDYAIFTGFHAKEGAEGIFPHSFREEFEYVKLGKRIVGELEIFINYLNAFEIKTLLVSGDAAAIKEIAYINCEKNIGKSQIKNENIEEKYLQLEKSVEKAIKERNYYEPQKFDSSNVQLKFKHNVKNFENMEQEKREGVIQYENTVQFVQQLDSICSWLNREIYIARIIRISRCNRELYIKLCLNREIKALLRKDVTLLTNEEIEKIFMELQNLKKAGIK